MKRKGYGIITNIPPAYSHTHERFIGQAAYFRPHSNPHSGLISVDCLWYDCVFSYIFCFPERDFDKYIKTTKFLDFISCQNLK